MLESLQPIESMTLTFASTTQGFEIIENLVYTHSSDPGTPFTLSDSLELGSIANTMKLLPQLKLGSEYNVVRVAKLKAWELTVHYRSSIEIETGLITVSADGKTLTESLRDGTVVIFDRQD
jgi:hypothetical protein